MNLNPIAGDRRTTFLPYVKVILTLMLDRIPSETTTMTNFAGTLAASKVVT
jgi:hypothetical protein